jgi:glycosyltransferase involved in cell wall biosynthesis
MLEALACNVPVLATPVGIAPKVLGGVPGALCAPFDANHWREALTRTLQASDPRIDGRDAAEAYSAHRMAQRLLGAWERMA